MPFSSIVRSRPLVNLAGIALVLAGLLVLPGCWVTSINPLYDDLLSSKDPDEVLDQSLTGSWIAIEDKCTTVLTISAKDMVYDLQSKGQGEGCFDAGKMDHQQARLVKLDTYYFLDTSPIPDDVCDMCIARHTIFQMKIDKDSLSLTPIDSDWLTKALAAKTVALATLPDNTYTLTASPADLKSFCRKFAGDKAVFKPDSTETLKRK